MKVLPVGLLLEGKLCVVVGGGRVAARKAAALLEAGAVVRVAAERFSRDFDALDDAECVPEAYSRRHIEDAAVVIAATSDPNTNLAVAADARKLGALVNVVDTPAECDFIFPAVSRKGDVSVAVSTGGASPLLARQLKDKIETSIEDTYGELAKVLKAVRRRAIDGIADGARRRAFFEALASDEFLEVIRRDGTDSALRQAESLLEKTIDRARKGSPP